jgi:hypothetical protein
MTEYSYTNSGQVLKCEHERYRTLIFALQTAWTFVHGSRDEALIKECSALLCHGGWWDDTPEPEISAERNDRIYAALERAWPYVNGLFVSNSAKSEVARALGISIAGRRI